MTLKTLLYEVTFLTPAFLGNAKQSGQWRTPPFKAALRQWWRVAWTSRQGFAGDLESMRLAEARLFGAASGTSPVTVSRKSELRLRLQHWREGLDQSPKWGSQRLLYLGYGPLEFQRGKGVVLKRSPAIQAGEKAGLAMALPADELDTVRGALALFRHYGTLGGRSRNGWGSIELESSHPDARSMSRWPPQCQRNWIEALDCDWPHAIGHDGRALIWATKKRHADWPTLMAILAEVRKSVRGIFKFSSATSPQAGHWLAYPVTKHEVDGWRSKRLPNSLRFKVRRDEDNPDHCRGVIFHMPCMPPCGFEPREDEIKSVWERVHQCLDNNAQLERIGA